MRALLLAQRVLALKDETTAPTAAAATAAAAAAPRHPAAVAAAADGVAESAALVSIDRLHMCLALMLRYCSIAFESFRRVGLKSLQRRG